MADKKQEVISIKFAINPDENERKAKEIYFRWKEMKIHKQMIIEAIINYANEMPVTNATMLKVLTMLADNLQESIEDVKSIQPTVVMQGGYAEETGSQFGDDFKDAMLGAWDG